MPTVRTPQKNRFGQSLFYVVLIALIIATLYTYGGYGPRSDIREVGINELYANEDVREVAVKDNEITAVLKDGSKIRAVKEPQDVVGEHFAGRTDVTISVVDTTKNQFWADLLVGVVPFILIVGFLFLMMRQAQSTHTSAMSFGKSKARLDVEDKRKTTFKDVAGAKEAKQELEEIVDFLKNPGKYMVMGAKIPRGVMLIGPPGTGKTLLARAVAGEAKVPFYSISGSEFVEMFVGVGASRVRDLFTKAKKNAPCIIFVDEIDAVGRQRGAGLGGGHDEREQTLNQILVEMDGFETDSKVIVIAATNRPDVLDSALLRPGRFDRMVTLDAPDLEAREEILKVHSRGKPIARGVVLKKIASQTPGFTGADLENLMNEAAILAARFGKKEITQSHLEQSIEKVTLGPERRSRVLNEHEKKVTAYHEAGHAIVAHMLPYCDPVHKVTIVSRGMALGVTWYLPDRDRHLTSIARFKDQMAAMLGGLVAEQFFFDDASTGPSNDLKKATEVARHMVTEYGMSRKLGPIIYGSDKHGAVFLGREIAEHRNYSESTAETIDAEVSELIREAHARALGIISKLKDIHKNIAEVLIEKESIDGKAFLKFFADVDVPLKIT